MEDGAPVGRVGPEHSHVLPGSTPVLLRGRQPDARVASVGINPSIREFLSRSGEELSGPRRTFETLSSLGVESMAQVTPAMLQRIRQRSLDYFDSNPYMDWFAPMETIIQGITGASYFDGSACHLDLVPWATQPLWGQLDRDTRAQFLAAGRPLLTEQLRNDALEIIYLNGRTVCDAVSDFIPLACRAARFRGQGPQRRFFRGIHHTSLVVGCSSNIQEERLRTADRQDFMDWIVSECRDDLDALATTPQEVASEQPPGR